MDIRAAEISDIIRKQIENYDKKVSVTETGSVLTAGDGIARVYGLSGAMAGELLEFEGAGGEIVSGMVLTSRRTTSALRSSASSNRSAKATR